MIARAFFRTSLFAMALCLAGSSLSHARGNGCLRRAFQALLEVKEEYGLEPRPRAFEVELAQRSGVSVEEIVAISRNFSSESNPGVLKDGSLGVFQIGNDHVIDPTVNLVNAYKNGMSRIRPGKMTIEDIVQLRRDASEVAISGDRIVTPPLRFKGSGETARVANLHPEVREKLIQYGYRLEDDASGTTTIHYESGAGRLALGKFTARLNEMVALEYPPEVVAAYAVQELLLIHPFQGGNGRTARMLGQILARKMTGRTLIFPESFHSEMGHSLHELVSDLHQPVSRWADLIHGIPKDERYAGTVLMAYQRDGILPERAPVGSANPKAHDSKFSEVKYDGQSISYRSLPPDTRAEGLSHPLYYGRPESSLEAAEKMVEVMFTQGRTSRGKLHKDVFLHAQQTANGERSGYFPTSKDLVTASSFASMRNGKAKKSVGPVFGVVFVVDPRGAELLDVYALGKRQGKTVYGDEGEIVFSETLSPTRIKAAIIYEGEGIKKVRRILMNPNYILRQ